MAPTDISKKLDRNQAKKLIAAIVAKGDVVPSPHVKERMRQRHLTMADVLNVLRLGRIEREPEFENGSWRYRVETDAMGVVVAFGSETELIIVTAWRNDS